MEIVGILTSLLFKREISDRFRFSSWNRARDAIEKRRSRVCTSRDRLIVTLHLAKVQRWHEVASDILHVRTWPWHSLIKIIQWDPVCRSVTALWFATIISGGRALHLREGRRGAALNLHVGSWTRKVSEKEEAYLSITKRNLSFRKRPSIILPPLEATEASSRYARSFLSLRFN